MAFLRYAVRESRIGKVESTGSHGTSLTKDYHQARNGKALARLRQEMR